MKNENNSFCTLTFLIGEKNFECSTLSWHTKNDHDSLIVWLMKDFLNISVVEPCKHMYSHSLSVSRRNLSHSNSFSMVLNLKYHKMQIISKDNETRSLKILEFILPRQTDWFPSWFLFHVHLEFFCSFFSRILLSFSGHHISGPIRSGIYGRTVFKLRIWCQH